MYITSAKLCRVILFGKHLLPCTTVLLLHVPFQLGENGLTVFTLVRYRSILHSRFAISHVHYENTIRFE